MDTHAHFKCYSITILYYLCFNLTFQRANASCVTVHVKFYTLLCRRKSDTDGGVKESLNGVSTELIGGEREKGGGGIRGLGECEEIDMEKEEKITNVI